MKKLSQVLLILLVVFSLAACTETESADPSPSGSISYEGNLVITNGDETIEVAYNDLYQMEAETLDMIGISSSGEETNYNFTGVKLNDVLADYDLTQEGFAFIRLEAGDGYAIDVPSEIAANKDIWLAYKSDGEVLEEKKMPLRSAIEGERSMYYVSNLTNIYLMESSSSDSSTGLEKIVFLDTAANVLTLEDYTYYESVDRALKASELLEAYSDSSAESVEFMATDDFEKTEMLDVISQGYIKMTGENSPLFLAPDLPKGMHTKYILTMDAKDVVFVSLESAFEYFESSQVGEYTGVAIKDILSLVELEAEAYTLEAADGYSVEVPHDDIIQGIIQKDEDIFRVRVPEELPKNYNLKDILSIAPIGVQAASNEDDSNVEQDDTGDVALSSTWEVEVSGLEDGSFVMTSDRANSKLDLVTVETSVIKDDETVEQTWQGYKVLDVLEFLKVEDFNSLEFIAGDGFSVEITAEEIDDNSILAVIEDGQELTEPDNLVRLVLDTQFSSNWIKGVSKIVIK